MNMEDCIWDYRNPHQWMKRVRESSFPPLVVCCALTGGGQGKEANPDLPETPEEQAEQAYEAYKIGASMVHIHARDANNLSNCSANPERYRVVNALIRAKCPDIIINNTTGAGPGMTPEERLCSVEANPEIASLNMGPAVVKLTLKERKAPLPHPRAEYRFEGCIPHDLAEVTMFARRMKEKGIKPEMELYNPGMYWAVEELIGQELIAPPYLFQFVMGYQSGFYPTPSNLLSFINELPAGSIYGVIGLGQFQLPMTVMSILLGGNVRVGMEDNVYARKGRLLRSNAEAVERIIRIARDMNREIATPSQARRMLGLSSKPSRY